MKSNLHLRHALMEDCNLLYEWANDQVVRDNSFHQNKILYKEHAVWFQNKLLSAVSRIYICYHDDIPVGQIRIDIIEDGMAEVSYSVDKKYRLQGYGKSMLILLEDKIKSDFPQVTELIAKVKSDNIASQVIFSDIGYEEYYTEYRKMINKSDKVKMRQESGGGGILYLTNNTNGLRLFQWLRETEECVEIYSGPLAFEMLDNAKINYVISYNYKYIIPSDVVQYLSGRIINLHASFLPWNRGANPNFWSFIDNTPKGISIHYIDAGLDTGEVLVQKELIFDEMHESFSSSYERINREMVKMFQDNWPFIKEKKLRPMKQSGEGSFHYSKELEQIEKKYPFSWDENIYEYKKRHKLGIIENGGG